jgi:hypothetical protein
MIFMMFLLGLPGFFLPSNIFQRYASVVAISGVLIWVQAYLLVWDYGVLDGRAIDWSAGAWRGWADILLWSTGLLLALLGSAKIHSWIIRLALILVFLQLASALFYWYQFSAELSEKAAIRHANVPKQELFEFSQQGNVLHIIADGFQSDIFEELVNENLQSGRIVDALDGFTFFPDNLGVFPYTHMSVPAILSSRIYRNHEPIKEFIENSFSGKNILNSVYSAGYDVDVVVPSGLLYMYKQASHTNLSSVPGRMHISDAEFVKRDAARLIDISLFRLSPHFIKDDIYNDQAWFIQSLMADKQYLALGYFAHMAFLRTFKESITINRDRPVYKFLHLMLSHNPIVANEQCGYAGRVLPTVRETVKTQARCALAALVELFDAMKKAGIYDSTLIVLMADHGAWVPPTGLTGIPHRDGKAAEVINPQFVALSQPLLAIKKPGDSGDMKANTAPSWIVDTAATVAETLNLTTKFDGKSVFRIDENESRKRSFFVYQYQRSDWNSDYLSPIQEFSINGKGVDSTSWHEDTLHLPGGISQDIEGRSSLWQTIKLQ